MSESIEIEFKNLLTREEFNRLKDHFSVDLSQFKKQVNHYFDTASFSLKEHGSALRIREKGESFELTLKQPALQGLLETTQSLTAMQADEALKSGVLPEGEVLQAVAKWIADPDSLLYFGSLTTERVEFDYQGGLLVLDHSYYLNAEDYEVEYEVTNEDEGFIIFSELLAHLKIPVRQTDNKIKRFYTKKYHSFKE